MDLGLFNSLGWYKGVYIHDEFSREFQQFDGGNFCNLGKDEKRGHFQSVELLEINLYLAQRRLKEGRWSKAIPKVKAHSYEIKQIFALRYEESEE